MNRNLPFQNPQRTPKNHQILAFYRWVTKTAGYPAVSYFLVTSLKRVPAGYFVPTGLIVSVLKCVRHSIRGPKRYFCTFGERNKQAKDNHFCFLRKMIGQKRSLWRIARKGNNIKTMWPKNMLGLRQKNNPSVDGWCFIFRVFAWKSW